jgi:hypothetical protein
MYVLEFTKLRPPKRLSGKNATAVLEAWHSDPWLNHMDPLEFRAWLLDDYATESPLQATDGDEAILQEIVDRTPNLTLDTSAPDER